MTYPDGEVVTYGYNAGGLVSTVSGARSGSTTGYVRRVAYDEFAQRRRIELSNGTTTDYAYDPSTRRLATLQARQSFGGSLFQALVYGYDLAGNVTSLRNELPVPPPAAPNREIAPGPTEQSFGYDDLYQLTSATGRYRGCACGCSNERRYTLGLTYDAIGNIKSKTQSDIIIQPSGVTTTQAATSYDVAYGYLPARPHAPSSIGAQTLTYDESGNTRTTSGLFGPARSMTWTEDDRLRTEVDSSFTNTYLYDAAGERTHKRRTTLETVYVNPLYVVRNGLLQTKHVVMGETRIASVVAPLGNRANPTTAAAGTPFFYHPDHLQSTAYVTGRDGSFLQHDEYFPSGEVWFQEAKNNDARNTQPWLFNAKELDETGLYYFGARYYNPKSSTWLSPDPILASYIRGEVNGGVFTPRNLGLYTYAWNNPVVLRDPDGKFVFLAIAAGVAYGILKSSGTLSAPAGGGEMGNKPTSTGDFVGHVLEAATFGFFAAGRPAVRESAGPGRTEPSTPTLAGEGAAPAPGPAPIGGAQSPQVRVNKVRPDPKAEGAHTSFKEDPTSGKITGYTEYDAAGTPVKRFRAEGTTHGGVEPPLVLERASGKNPPSPLNRARPAAPAEIPQRR